MRIIREFDYKNYRKRMGVPCSTVLCALFGCYKADKELIRHGMTRKWFWINELAFQLSGRYHNK